MELSARGLLLLGLPYNGKLYFEVKVHAMTIGDECEALEAIENSKKEASLSESQIVQNMLVDLAYLSAQIEIVGVPKSVLTPQFLLENLSTDDYAILFSLIDDVRKKRIDAGESPETADDKASTKPA